MGFLLAACLIIGMLSGFLLVRAVNSEEPELEEQFSPSPQLVEVVVMLQTVQAGWIMTENEVTTDLRLVESVPETAVVNINDVVGREARFDLYQGETVTNIMLGPPAYEALMVTQPISRGTPITADMVRFVSVPYDSPLLQTNTIIYEERFWSIDMTARFFLWENRLLSWDIVTATETIGPPDPYLAAKSERDQVRLESIWSAPAILSLEQRQSLERLATLGYPTAFLLGVVIAMYISRRRRRRQVRSE